MDYQIDYRLTASVASGSSVTVPYARGTGAANFKRVTFLSYSGESSLSTSAATAKLDFAGITVTNSTGATWNAGDILRLVLHGSDAVRNKSRILTRSLTGRSNAVAASGNAFGTGGALAVGLCQHQRVALAAHFDSVRIAIPNMHTSSVASVLGMVGVSNALGAWSTSAPILNNTGAATSASPTPSETVSSAGSGLWRNLTWSGASSVTLPAAVDATNLVPSYSWSDWAPVYSVARTDGGTFPLLDIRIFIPVAAGSMTLAYTGASNNAWAMWGRDDLFTNGRTYRVWNQDVDGVTTPTAFTSTTTQPMIVPLLIQYRSRFEGESVCVVGDSIYDATTGSTYTNNGWAWQGVSGISQTYGPVEYCSLSAGGATTLQSALRAENQLSQVKPTIVVFPAASVNNFGTSLGSRVQQEGQGAVGKLLALASGVSVRETQPDVVIGSMLPVTNAAKAWGSTDAQRITLNNEMRNRSVDSGFTFLDFGPTIDGTTTSGQIEPKSTYVGADGIHPNDTGYTAMAVPFKTALESIILSR